VHALAPNRVTPRDPSDGSARKRVKKLSESGAVPAACDTGLELVAFASGVSRASRPERPAAYNPFDNTWVERWGGRPEFTPLDAIYRGVWSNLGPRRSASASDESDSRTRAAPDGPGRRCEAARESRHRLRVVRSWEAAACARIECPADYSPGRRSVPPCWEVGVPRGAARSTSPPSAVSLAPPIQSWFWFGHELNELGIGADLEKSRKFHVDRLSKQSNSLFGMPEHGFNMPTAEAKPRRLCSATSVPR
jgi:hypothetical protein